MYQKRSHPIDLRLAHHTISSAPPSGTQHAVPFPGVPCRAVRYCCAMLCGVVRCCIVLCRGEFMPYQKSHLVVAWLIINSAPLSRAHRSASSAAQRRAVPCGAVLLLCGALRCCAVLRAFSCTFLTYMPSIIPSVIPPVLLLYVPGTVC